MGIKKIERRANADVRNAIKASGFCQWEVADALGYSEAGFTRMLRRELSDEGKGAIYDVIEQMKTEALHG